MLLAACSSEWIRDYDGYLPRADRLPGTAGSTHAVLVVDAGSGIPLRSVRARLYRENAGPQAVDPTVLVDSETDEYGLVWLRWREEYADCSWVFEKEGYAPHEERGVGSEVVELHPGHDVEGQLLGIDGRPAANVPLEYVLGIPVLRHAATDAEGRFVIRGVDLDEGFLWAAVPNACEGPLPLLRGPRPGFVLEPIRLRPGVTARGRVLDASGRAVPGAVVHTHPLWQRARRAATDGEGRFVLPGLSTETQLRVYPPHLRLEVDTMDGPPASEPPSPAPASIVRVCPPGGVDEYTAFSIDTQMVSNDGGDAESSPELAVADVAEIRTTWTGPVRLQFCHREFGSGETVIEVSRPVTDVGPEQFPTPRTLSVGHGGRWSLEEGLQIEAYGDYGWEPLPSTVLPSACVVTSWRLRDGVMVRITGPGIESRRRLQGDGPYAIRLGEAGLEVQLVGGGCFVVYVDGVLGGWYETEEEIQILGAAQIDEERGTVLLRGLDAGPHTVIVGAQGRVAKVMRIVLAEGVTRRIEVALRRRGDG